MSSRENRLERQLIEGDSEPKLHFGNEFWEIIEIFFVVNSVLSCCIILFFNVFFIFYNLYEKN